MRNPKGCWQICIAAALAQFCTIGLNINVFSVYFPYISNLLELTYNQNSAFMLIRNVCSVGSVYLAKIFYDKLEMRVGYTVILMLNALGVYLLACTQSFGMFCIAAVVSGLSYGLGGIYPTAILIHRWFPYHEGLAMGICSASSGLALTIGAPIITALTENYSMNHALYCEICFLTVILIVCFILIRNYPDTQMHYTHRPKSIRHRTQFNVMSLAIMAVGIFGGCFGYLTIYYTAEGLNPYQVSLVVSIAGFVLTASKFLLGEFLDLFGAYRINWIFLSLAILSCVFFSIGGTNLPIVVIGVILFGIGAGVTTVGVPVYAKDLSSPTEFAATQQQYQSAFLSGGLVCAIITGPIATITGSYRIFFVIVTLLILMGSGVIQFTYWKKLKRK